MSIVKTFVDLIRSAAFSRRVQTSRSRPVIMRMIPVAVAAANVLMVSNGPAVAGTLTAATCAYDDVRWAVGSASDGDTVIVPAGNCSWSSGVAISKAITLKGAGVGRTIIRNYYTGGSLISVTESANGNIRIEGFDFIFGTGPLSGNPDFFINVLVGANGRPVLVTGNRFALAGSGNALGFKTNRGVIWSNTFTGTPSGGNCANNASALRHKHGIMSSWTTAPTYGTADVNGDRNLYFETNTLTDVLEGIDVDDNARLVFRYNHLTNSGFLHHGADTSGSGGRYSEVYNNTFVHDLSAKCSVYPTNVNGWIFIRGGTTLVHSNVIPNIVGQAWGEKAEVSMIVENLRRRAGPYPCWSAGYPVPHQAGWGYSGGSTRAGSTSIYQDVEPTYIWNNSGSGNYNTPAIPDYSPNECGSGAPSSTAFIQRGRDYYTGIAKPGYTPYTYPHPLTNGTSTGGGTPTAPLPAPTNLQVR